jgi:hypothetical protein
MKKKLYTGAYLLYNKDHQSQFGLVDGTADLNKNTDTIRISFAKQILEKIQRDDEDGFTINLTVEECAQLADTLKTVEHSLQLLKTLSKRGKLTDDAYLTDESDFSK